MPQSSRTLWFTIVVIGAMATVAHALYFDWSDVDVFVVTGLVHQIFLPGLDLPQVADSRRGYAGSNKAVSVERNSIKKEHVLEQSFFVCAPLA